MLNSTKLKLSSFISALYFYVPVFSLYLVDNNVSLSNIVFAQVLYSIFAFGFEVPTGIFADKVGQKYSIFLGHMCDALGLLLVLLFPSVTFLYVAQSIRGISGAFLSGSNEALMYEFVKKENGDTKKYKKEYATFLSNAIFGFALSTFIAGVILQFFRDVSYPYLMGASVTALIINLFLVLTIKDIHAEIKLVIGSKRLFYEVQKSFSLIKQSNVLRAIMFTLMITYAGKYFLMETYQPYFELNSVPPLFIGLVISIGSLINFVVVRYSYLLEYKLLLPSIILLITSFIGVGYIVLGAFVAPLTLILSFLMIYGLIGAESPVISDFINANIPSDIRSTALSGISFGRELAKTILKLFLGVLIGALGTGNTYIIYGAYLIFGGIVSFSLLRKNDCVYDTWERLKAQRV